MGLRDIRNGMLEGVASIVIKRPTTVLITALVFTIGAALLVPGLKIQAGHSSLFDKDAVHQRRFAAFLERFGSPNVMFVIVRGGDDRTRRRVIDALVAKVPQKPGASGGSCNSGAAHQRSGCVRDVIGRIDPAGFRSFALLYAPIEQLKKMVTGLTDPRVPVAKLRNVSSLAGLFTTLAEFIESQAEGEAPTDEQSKQAKTAMSGVSKAVAMLNDALTSTSPLDLKRSMMDAIAKTSGGDATRPFSGVDPQGYLISRDDTLHIALIRPVNESDEPDVVIPFVDYVRNVADAELKTLGAKNIDVILTGLPALITAEKKALNHDIPLTTIIAIAGVLALFIFGFRSITQGLVGLGPLAVALVGTLAFVRLTYGHLNILTSTFIPTLVGLGIDFSVHILARFNESRRQGATPEEGVREALIGAGPGLITGGLTTAGAFFAISFNEFEGFSQLGVITCFGLVLSLVGALFVTSAMLRLPSLKFLQNPPKARVPKERDPWMVRSVLKYRWVVLLGGVAISSLLLWRATQTPWSYNFLDLQPKGYGAVEGMDLLSAKTDFSGEMAAMVAPDLKTATTRITQLKQRETVGRVESLISYVPRQQKAKLAELRKLRPLFAEDRNPSQPSKDPLTDTREALQSLIDAVQDAQFAAKQAGHPTAKLMAGPIKKLNLLKQTLSKDDKALAKRLSSLNVQLDNLVREGELMLKSAAYSGPVLPENLLGGMPEGLRTRLYSKGAYALYIYPKDRLWEKGYLPRFVGDLRQVDHEATGFPVNHWEANVAIEGGFRSASLYSILALVLLLFLDFRSLRYTFLAIIPLGLGIAWMSGSIGLLGMDFNFANVVCFPLIIGIGVASGVHILHRYRQEGEASVGAVIRHTGMAIFLSAATTMVGFGSLAFGIHPGASSVGVALFLGVGACLATSVIILPALLKILGGKKHAAN